MVGRALASGYIGTHRVKDFLRRLGSPLGPPPPPAAAAHAPLSANHAAQTHAWFRPVLREVTTLHIPGKGVPFGELLETLVAVRLGPNALTIDVRLKREQAWLSH